METKNQALQDFIKEHGVDIELFYSMRIDSQKVYLQGYISTKALLIFKDFGNLKIVSSGCLQLDFTYNEIEFHIYLTPEA